MRTTGSRRKDFSSLPTPFDLFGFCTGGKRGDRGAWLKRAENGNLSGDFAPSLGAPEQERPGSEAPCSWREASERLFSRSFPLQDSARRRSFSVPALPEKTKSRMNACFCGKSLSRTQGRHR